MTFKGLLSRDKAIQYNKAGYCGPWIAYTRHSAAELIHGPLIDETKKFYGFALAPGFLLPMECASRDGSIIMIVVCGYIESAYWYKDHWAREGQGLKDSEVDGWFPEVVSNNK